MKEVVAFWKHDDPNGYLSNWYRSTILTEGYEFPTAEHLIMFWKARFFGDESAAQKILAAETPAVAKRIGREVKKYVDSDWSAVRYYVDAYVQYLKFSQHQDLRIRLLQTTGTIVEASPVDRIWGAGAAEKDLEHGWQGQNLHGKALREIRETLKKE